MLQTFKSIANFEVIMTPTIMLDDTFLGEIFDEKENLNTNIKKNDTYSVLTIVNREKCFNYELSDYLPSELDSSKPGFIKKYVLNYSDNLPPIFRINESPSKLFISEEAKNALEKNNIKGCVFEEVEVTPFVS